MAINRRAFLKRVGAVAAAGLVVPASVTKYGSKSKKKYKLKPGDKVVLAGETGFLWTPELEFSNLRGPDGVVMDVEGDQVAVYPFNPLSKAVRVRG